MSGRRVESRTYAPPSDLADVLDVFWTGRWDLPAEAPHTTELLSDPCADDEAGFTAMTVWLRERKRAHATTGVAVALVDRIAKDPTITTVAALARVAGYGPRALQKLFGEEVGACPKWVIARHRLQEAALRIERGDGPSLAALAAELGYADHAHLARDFKRAVGKSPSAFAASVHV